MTQTESISSNGAAAARLGWATMPIRLGRWDLVALAAEGSLAQVYRARPAESPADLPAAYAVKILHPSLQDDPRALGLLHREVEVGRNVAHPHLVSILGASLAVPPQYVVMPWLEGATLADHLSAGRMFDLPAAFWIARQAAEALAALDEAGWMHGDVKPGNIQVSPEGHVTLLDLGFARRRDETGPAAEHRVAGTYPYMAPEHFTPNMRPDVRSDLYSLGVVLFELLSGRLPFEGKRPAELAEKHKQAAPPNLPAMAPYLPADAVGLVRRMLAKDPLRRQQTPREAVDRLAALEIATFSERAA